MADLQRLLFPRSIAIVGVSEDPKTIRGRLLHVLLHRGYTGPLHLVSRRMKQVLGRPTLGSLAELPEVPDLAILASPAEAVPGLIAECGERGIRAVLVIASGFAEEVGEGGARRQRELRAIAAKYGMAICGPNTEGFVNNIEKVSATFCPVLENESVRLDAAVLVARRAAVISQSGGFAFTFLSLSQQRQISYSFMISSGNESCTESGDYLDFLLDKGGTDMFLMYLEGVKSPGTFTAALKKAADQGKPVIAAKAGRSSVGRQAAATHTGSLTGEARVFDAVFDEYGVIPGGSLEQMIDTAVAFTYCKLPRGRRVGIISNSGGGAVWMSDMLSEAGFEVPALDAATSAEIQALLPAYGVSRNPIDLTAQAVREVGYARVVDIVARSGCVDLIIVIGSLAYEYIIQKDRDHFARITAGFDVPVAFCTYTTASPKAVELLASAGIPAYTSMPNCVRALSALAGYGEFQRRWQTRRTAAAQSPAVKPALADAAAKALAAARQSCAALSEARSKELLEAWGLPRPAERLVQNADEAVAAAGSMGFPVALKAQSAEIPHKTEAGAVALGLGDDAELRQAFAGMQQRIAGRITRPVEGFLMQKMAPPGIEVSLGVKRDAQFGPMLMLGLGGIFIELLDDVALAPAPVSRERALELLRGLRGARIFGGFRGRPPADLEALADVASRLSWFAHQHRDSIAEIDLNPVIVHERGLSIVDALIVTAPAGEQA